MLLNIIKFQHTLLLISGQELSAELYDTAADMVFSFICKCRVSSISRLVYATNFKYFILGRNIHL